MVLMSVCSFNVPPSRDYDLGEVSETPGPDMFCCVEIMKIDRCGFAIHIVAMATIGVDLCNWLSQSFNCLVY